MGCTLSDIFRVHKKHFCDAIQQLISIPTGTHFTVAGSYIIELLPWTHYGFGGLILQSALA